MVGTEEEEAVEADVEAVEEVELTATEEKCTGCSLSVKHLQ
jgi:hypothetical protein